MDANTPHPSHGSTLDAEHHGHGHGADLNRHLDRRALRIAFAITFAFMLAEAVGGWISGSLALIADAGHMLTDVSALGLSLVANWLAGKPAMRRRTYGLYRAEIIAAFLNAVTLFVICGFIFFEAYLRFRDPPELQAGWMLAIAVLGLLANAATLLVLWRSGGSSLNLRGALLHVIGDLLGSVGAITAAAIVLATGWRQADAVISVIIAVLILFSAWRLLYETLRVLLEIAPPHIKPEDVEVVLRALPGVAEVHDVHVWTITSGMEAVSGHLRLTDDDVNGARLEKVLQQAYVELAQFDFKHVTLQVEPFHHREPPGRM